MCKITITNKEGVKIKLLDQRGPTCGLYALSLALKYLCDIDYPATKGDSEGVDKSLRRLFKDNEQTIIGEIYDAAQFASLVNSQFGEGLCFCESFNLERMKQITDEGGLCLVPFCVDISTGLPSDGGKNAHWCVIHECKPSILKACHWGMVFDFDSDKLRKSNAAIQDTPLSYYGKVDGEAMTYVECESATSTVGLDGDSIKHGSIKEIPESPLSQTLANKMVVIPKP